MDVLRATSYLQNRLIDTATVGSVRACEKYDGKQTQKTRAGVQDATIGKHSTLCRRGEGEGYV